MSSESILDADLGKSRNMLDEAGSSSNKTATSPAALSTAKSDGIKFSSLDPQIDDTEIKMYHPPEKKLKIVLKNSDDKYLETAQLPEGWISVTHDSGIPIYLHLASRICTLSRPYYLGADSVRHHDVPSEAIPCYFQRKIKEWEDQKLPTTKLRTNQDFRSRRLKANQLHDYCANTFEFKTIETYRFKSWSDCRAFKKMKKRNEKRQNLVSTTKAAVETEGAAVATETQSDGMKLIPKTEETETTRRKKSYFFNPQGKSAVIVLHEYVHRVLKGKITYEFGDTDDVCNPRFAVAKIETYQQQCLDAGELEQAALVEYRRCEGSSNKIAKAKVAEDALRVLLPELKFNLDGLSEWPQQDDVEKLFDSVELTDSRVPELLARAAQPTPFEILEESLKCDPRYESLKLFLSCESIGFQKNQCTLHLSDDDVVKVKCKTKKEGKQRAAQAMLNRLYPHMTWRSLIHFYGTDARVRLLEEKRVRQEEMKRLLSENKEKRVYQML